MAARSVSATSLPPLARNSASSAERATITEISTVTSGWEVDLDLVLAQRLDRLVEFDLAALDLHARSGSAVGDVARGDRTVELAPPEGLGATGGNASAALLDVLDMQVLDDDVRGIAQMNPDLIQHASIGDTDQADSCSHP